MSRSRPSPLIPEAGAATQRGFVQVSFWLLQGSLRAASPRPHLITGCGVCLTQGNLKELSLRTNPQPFKHSKRPGLAQSAVFKSVYRNHDSHFPEKRRTYNRSRRVHLGNKALGLQGDGGRRPPCGKAWTPPGCFRLGRQRRARTHPGHHRSEPGPAGGCDPLLAAGGQRGVSGWIRKRSPDGRRQPQAETALHWAAPVFKPRPHQRAGRTAGASLSKPYLKQLHCPPSTTFSFLIFLTVVSPVQFVFPSVRHGDPGTLTCTHSIFARSTPKATVCIH